MESAVTWSIERYVEALRFAAYSHGAKNQLVPGTTLPYVCHPVVVAAELLAALPHHPGVDGDLAVTCALLHDTIEDTDCTYDDLADRFGAAVADGVAALSKRAEAAGDEEDPIAAKRLKMRDSLERIRRQPHEVWMVKLADRITNLMKPPAYWTTDKRRAYREEGREILEALGEASPWLAERLAQRIEAYGAFIES